uniref:Uncharacterized protein MANES_03G104600 n=1 Tax=Rhizophora mucronata TaxID=61149 RepID=A0A2P2KV44_RHIMU
MRICDSHFHVLSPLIFPLFHHHHHGSASVFLPFLHKPNSLFSLSAFPPTAYQSWLIAQLPDLTSAPSAPPGDGGPLELPLSSSIFASTDDPSPIQVATSVLLTGAISVFLFRAIRRRAKRVKELRFRSSGTNKTLKEEGLDSLKAMGSGPLDAKKTPSPAQAFLGGISAGVIALILYKFTTTIEAALNRQTLSDSYSVCSMSTNIHIFVLKVF